MFDIIFFFRLKNVWLLSNFTRYIKCEQSILCARLLHMHTRCNAFTYIYRYHNVHLCTCILSNKMRIELLPNAHSYACIMHMHSVLTLMLNSFARYIESKNHNVDLLITCSMMSPKLMDIANMSSGEYKSEH